MTALSNRDQVATLAELHGWTPVAIDPAELTAGMADRYRRDDVVVGVSFTATGRIRNADRMVDGWDPADCQIVEPRGKIAQVSAWLRHDTAPRQTLVEAAGTAGWEVIEHADRPLALVRGTLDTGENAPSAAEQDSTEAVTLVFAEDGQVLFAAAKGWAHMPDGTPADVLAAILDRLAWAPPSVHCLDCRTPEHRHHLGELGQRHPFRSAMPASTQLIGRVLRPEPARRVEVLDVREGIAAGWVAPARGPVILDGGTIGCTHGVAWSSDCASCAADRADARGMHDPESPDFDPDVRDQDVERETQVNPGDHPAGTGDDGDPLDLLALADQLAGAAATLVGIARPDQREVAQREGREITRVVRAMLREVRATRERVVSCRTQLAERTAQRDLAIRHRDDAASECADLRGDLAAAHRRLGEQGRQLAAAARELREATATKAAQDAADGAARQLAGRSPGIDPTLLSGNVSPRALVEAMAQGDYVELSPAEHGQPGDQLVRIGWAARGRRIAGYLVGDDLLATRQGERGGVPAAGVVAYLAAVARRSDTPTASTRVGIADGVRRQVEAVRRAAGTR